MEKIVEFVVCPIDKGKLIDKQSFWECIKCGTKYKVNEGIPNLIPEEAESSDNKLSVKK